MAARTSQALVCYLALGMAAPSLARAWPVDELWDLPVGGAKVERIAHLSFADVDDHTIAAAEKTATGELVVTGKRRGATLVLLSAEGQVAVVRVRVGAKGGDEGRAAEPKSADLLGAVQKSCDDVSVTGGKLSVRVANDGCRHALFSLLSTDAFLSDKLVLTLDVDAMRRQLEELQRAFAQEKLAVTARYLGAGLSLSGTMSPEAHRRALWLVFRNSLGRIALDDQVQIAPGPGRLSR